MGGFHVSTSRNPVFAPNQCNARMLFWSYIKTRLLILSDRTFEVGMQHGIELDETHPNLYRTNPVLAQNPTIAR